MEKSKSNSQMNSTTHGWKSFKSRKEKIIRLNNKTKKKTKSEQQATMRQSVVENYSS